MLLNLICNSPDDGLRPQTKPEPEPKLEFKIMQERKNPREIIK